MEKYKDTAPRVGQLISQVKNTGGENLAITHETMLVMLQSGLFLIALLNLIVSMTQKKK